MRKFVLPACTLSAVVAVTATAIYLNATRAAPTPCEWIGRERPAQLCTISDVWGGLEKQAKEAPTVTARSANIAVTHSAAVQARQL